MGKPESPLDFLQNWYLSQCNEDCEHEFGVKVATLDNPGWWVRIALEDSDFDGCVLAEVDIETPDGRWLSYGSNGKQFEATCDPLSLGELLARFRDFIDGATAMRSGE